MRTNPGIALLIATAVWAWWGINTVRASAAALRANHLGWAALAAATAVGLPIATVVVALASWNRPSSDERVLWAIVVIALVMFYPLACSGAQGLARRECGR